MRSDHDPPAAMTPEDARRDAARRRQARYRARERARDTAHAAGDHSTCRPGRCEAASVPVELDGSGLNEAEGDAGGGVTGDVTPTPGIEASHREPPAGLGLRGLRLWEEMAGLQFGPAHVLLLERTCRLADRCARLDAQLEGGDWLELVEVPGTDGAAVRVIVDRALSELRQHDVALKLNVAELRHAGRPAAASARPLAGSEPAVPGTTAEGTSGGNVSSIAAAIAARRRTSEA